MPYGPAAEQEPVRAGQEAQPLPEMPYEPAVEQEVQPVPETAFEPAMQPEPEFKEVAETFGEAPYGEMPEQGEPARTAEEFAGDAIGEQPETEAFEPEVKNDDGQ